MSTTSYEIRVATREEIDIAIDWAAKEGWNPGLNDAACYYLADPRGFYVGLLAGKPIVMASAIKYGKSFGFVGFYIVKPEYRGKFYGPKMGKFILNQLEGRIIGIDGVIEKQGNYHKIAGFKFAYRHMRYQDLAGSNTGKVSVNSGIKPIPLLSLDFEYIANYDKAFFPVDRLYFIKSWLSQEGTQSLGVMQNNKLIGYGVMRPCLSGYKIGPLFADTPIVAETIFCSFKELLDPLSEIYLDIPEVNGNACALVKKYEMKLVFETARMYKGKVPEISVDRTYGITSFEVG
ncbi:MAG: GNAT family N-acetyltransferase [bacterium]|nr:GNAT family N-acetyltransferase [bacterium]